MLALIKNAVIAENMYATIALGMVWAGWGLISHQQNVAQSVRASMYKLWKRNMEMTGMLMTPGNTGITQARAGSRQCPARGRRRGVPGNRKGGPLKLQLTPHHSSSPISVTASPLNHFS